jgi:hypothetical protein
MDCARVPLVLLSGTVSMHTNDDPALGCHEVPAARARVKVLNPLTSTGPSMHAGLVNCSQTSLQVRVPRCILRGSAVQVRTSDGIVFGEVQSCVPAESEFEIEVTLQSRV